MKVFIILLCLIMFGGCSVYLAVPFAIALLFSWLNSAVDVGKR